MNQHRRGRRLIFETMFDVLALGIALGAGLGVVIGTTASAVKQKGVLSIKGGGDRPWDLRPLDAGTIGTHDRPAATPLWNQSNSARQEGGG